MEHQDHMDEQTSAEVRRYLEESRMTALNITSNSTGARRRLELGYGEDSLVV
jgi:hypothetical protein